jgi:hypothetical protein
VTISSADVYNMLASYGSKVVTITRAASGASVDVLAGFRQTAATDLAAGGAIYQQGVSVIISAEEILSDGAWPGSTPVGFAGDPRIPARGDTIAIEGRDRSITASHPIYVNGNLVRVNIEVDG